MKPGNARWKTAMFNTRLQVPELGLGNSATNASLWKVNHDYGEPQTNGTADTALGARIAEQTLMNELGGKAAMDGGKLLNIRNAVAPKRWDIYNIPPPK